MGESQDAMPPDELLKWMKDNRVPLTTENYLDLAYFGNPPELDAEGEASLPKELLRATSGRGKKD